MATNEHHFTALKSQFQERLETDLSYRNELLQSVQEVRDTMQQMTYALYQMKESLKDLGEIFRNSGIYTEESIVKQYSEEQLSFTSEFSDLKSLSQVEDLDQTLNTNKRSEYCVDAEKMCSFPKTISISNCLESEVKSVINLCLPANNGVVHRRSTSKTELNIAKVEMDETSALQVFDEMFETKSSIEPNSEVSSGLEGVEYLARSKLTMMKNSSLDFNAPRTKFQKSAAAFGSDINKSAVDDVQSDATNEIDSKALMDYRKLFQREMERYQIAKQETKTKALSKEGLEQQPKTYPREKAKSETRDWLNNCYSKVYSFVHILAITTFCHTLCWPLVLYKINTNRTNQSFGILNWPTGIGTLNMFLVERGPSNFTLVRYVEGFRNAFQLFDEMLTSFLYIPATNIHQQRHMLVPRVVVMDWNQFDGKDKELTLWDVVLDMLLIVQGKMSSIALGDAYAYQMYWLSDQILERTGKEVSHNLTEVNVDNINEILDSELPKWLSDIVASYCMICNVRFHHQTLIELGGLLGLLLFSEAKKLAMGIQKMFNSSSMLDIIPCFDQEFFLGRIVRVHTSCSFASWLAKNIFWSVLSECAAEAGVDWGIFEAKDVPSDFYLAAKKAKLVLFQKCPVFKWVNQAKQIWIWDPGILMPVSLHNLADKVALGGME